MSDEFFQDDHVKAVLLSRGKNKINSTCVSGEDIDGTHYHYTEEYLRWNLEALHIRVGHKYSEGDRKQWFIDNPEPPVKFKEDIANYE